MIALWVLIIIWTMPSGPGRLEFSFPDEENCKVWQGHLKNNPSVPKDASINCEQKEKEQP